MIPPQTDAALADVARALGFELVCRDRHLFEEHDQHGRPLQQFDLVILDESERIKNRESTTSEVIR